MTAVELVPMTTEELGPYLEEVIPEYAADHVRDGQWTPEESQGEARREIAELIPQGLATPGHHVYTIHAAPGRGRVGVIWAYVEGPRAFVYDLKIDAKERRKGYGRAAMLAVEPLCRQFGATHIGLHVFGDNRGARELYRALGYRETNVVMSKELP